MIETWKTIKDWEGLYEVSNLGRVKSLRRNIILKPRPNKTGYIRVMLCNDNKRKELFIHKLVAEAFIPNPENKPQVDHLNTNILDNNVNNLRWCTQSENIRNPITYERQAKSRYKKVQCVETGKTFESSKEASLFLGLNRSSVSHSINGGYKCGGFYWRYVK